MDESLRRAAREGDVSDLYAIIQRDGNVLRRVGKVEFADTPLHIAAQQGCIDFAMELMSLKPAFATRLNQQGLTPLHLAVEMGNKELVLLLMGIDKDLVRVKGKKGETPFHYVITSEANHELLPRFLEACPECIHDLNTENQTALHIAVRSNKLKALKILCQMLRKTNYCQDVVNQKDRNGNTALHLAARDDQHEMLKLLLQLKADKHVTNQAGSTALDVAKQYNNKECISILRGCFIPKISTLCLKLQKQFLNSVARASLQIFRNTDNISGEDRSALLVILGLLLTATFQASLSPPGSVWQESNDSSISSNSTLSISSNSTLTPEQVTKPAGTSIMSQSSFISLYLPTCGVFIITFFLILGLLEPFPRGFRTALQALLSFLAICFLQSILVLAPTRLASLVITAFSTLVFVLMMFMCIAYRVSKVSIVILGCWLLPPLFVGLLLFFLLYDEFWKGTILVVGYSLGYGLVYGSIIGIVPFLPPVIVAVGCWLFLSLCRFCIKRCSQCCNA